MDRAICSNMFTSSTSLVQQVVAVEREAVFIRQRFLYSGSSRSCTVQGTLVADPKVIHNELLSVYSLSSEAKTANRFT